MIEVKYLELNTGHKIPSVGFGTWKIPNNDDGVHAITLALEAGYRHLDTASIYRNEQAVGKAIKQSGLRRNDLFVTTKLFPTQFFRPRQAIEQSLADLELDYVDLYLVHWPPQIGVGLKVWRAMESFSSQGLARSIGVSNYNQDKLRRLLAKAKIKPAVNQVEMHPFMYQHNLLDYCAAQQIVVEAYSPLTRGARLHNDTLVRLAYKHKKSTAQVLLRWCLQHGTVPLPKATKPENIHQNLAVFDFRLDESDMQALDELNESKSYLRA